MILAGTIAQLQRAISPHWGKKKIGFVPTMGDLHAGHISLIRRSKRENGVTAVSIFVNPAQFDRKKDFERYRRNLRNDAAICKREYVDVLFVPKASEIYGPGFQTWVEPGPLAEGLCGRYRPGHFRGVATVVLKLLNLVWPTSAYFGRKDYQQFKIIEAMARDFHLPVRIESSATIREPDGLALSSRNRRLSPSARLRAAQIFPALLKGSEMIESKKSRSQTELSRIFKRNLALGKGDRLEYFEAVHPDTLIPSKNIGAPVLLACAVWIGGVRLIDNLLVESR